MAVHAIAPASGQIKRKVKKYGRWTPYLLILPAVFFEILIHFLPMLFGLWISLVSLTRNTMNNWTSAPWNNFDNYKNSLFPSSVFSGPLFVSLGVTCLFTVVVVGLSWLTGMAAAVALQRPLFGRSVFRTIFLIPYALPMFAGILVFNFMFGPNGAVNHLLITDLHLTGLLKALGLINQFQIDNGGVAYWLASADSKNAFIALVVATVWRSWPFCFLMLMAGLQSIPNDIYEAGELDGAGWFRQWRSLTLPMLGSVNKVLILVECLWTFNDFNGPNILFGSNQPSAGGDIIAYHIYNATFVGAHYGLGAAMSTMLLVILLIFSGIFLLITNRKDSDA